jgi:hypothetical protein
MSSNGRSDVALGKGFRWYGQDLNTACNYGLKQGLSRDRNTMSAITEPADLRYPARALS